MAETIYNCDCNDTTNNKTLKQLRDDMMIRLGFAAQVNNPPPGMAALLNSFLIEAQELLYRRYEVLRTERFYSWALQAGVRMYAPANNDEAAVLPTPTLAAFTTATAGGTLAAGTYSYRVAAKNANGTTLASAAATIATTGTTSTVTVNWNAVVAPTGASPVTGYDIYGRTAGGELLLASVGLVTTYTDTGAAATSGALPTANTTAICPKTLDPRKVTWVGVVRDGLWCPLICGIEPEMYSVNGNGNGWPLRYEIRQCIEVWPAPGATEGSLVVKGHFGLEAFAADTDKTTIDDRLVFLLALSNAKAHYGRPDAGNYVQELETLMGNLVAGSHQTRRYLPGHDRRQDYVYSRPTPTVPFA
ncbi:MULTISPECIES: hypothetical protein [unclassified Rhodanobacter]|uniref:hypothetical protein n=1 Tax=unclassified Rhodanobacter TaxID=2621553 RepID=UPI0034E482D4